jgi:hypothetical protein
MFTVQHEAQPAEHPDFPQLPVPRENRPHALGDNRHAHHAQALSASS